MSNNIFYCGIDLSMRSTGVVILDDGGHLIDYTLVSYPDDDESLLLKNTARIITFIQKYENNLNGIALEGLAFLAKSAQKDIIAGNFWYLRCNLLLTFPELHVKIVPVTTWRKYIIDKERAKELRKTKEKDWAKKECVSKLPNDIRIIFEKYLKDNKFKKESLYDLTDSYFIAKWCLNERGI